MWSSEKSSWGKEPPGWVLENKYRLDSHQGTYSLRGQNLKQWFPNYSVFKNYFESLICIPKPHLQRFYFIWSGVEPKNLHFIKLPRKFCL